MAAGQVQDFHPHIYFDPEDVERAKTLAAEVQSRFGVPVGRFMRRVPA